MPGRVAARVFEVALLQRAFERSDLRYSGDVRPTIRRGHIVNGVSLSANAWQLGGLSRRGDLAPVLLKTQVTDVVRSALSAGERRRSILMSERFPHGS